jgi:hypothetical protein
MQTIDLQTMSLISVDLPLTPWLVCRCETHWLQECLLRPAAISRWMTGCKGSSHPRSGGGSSSFRSLPQLFRLALGFTAGGSIALLEARQPRAASST